MKKFFEALVLSTLLFTMGFLAYPLLFVPLGALFFPEFMEKLVDVYAVYLRQVWGFSNMIEYADILDKRVIIVMTEEEGITLIPGVAKLDKENYMFEVFPDKEVMEEWDANEAVGIGCETFENDVIRKLEDDHNLKKKYNVEYAIML
jgi:hypothetical protein